jgi:hypothetical protein
MNARGPAYEKYVLQLQDDCNKVSSVLIIFVKLVVNEDWISA